MGGGGGSVERGTRLPHLAAPVRTHTRRDIPQPSWDRLRQIRKDIQALQSELERELDRLEEEGDPD